MKAESIALAITFAGTQQKLASHIGVSQAAVQKWLSGKCKPSLTSAVRIERFTDGAITAIELRPDLADVLKDLEIK